MTPDNDIDRVLDQWFAEGPMQMPGRFLDDTLDRIDHLPRRHSGGLRPGIVRSNPRRLVAAAAVVTLLVAGIGSAVVLRTPAVGTSPSPSPSAGARSDPALLVGSWMSDGTRHVPFQNGSHTLDTVRRVDIVMAEADVRLDQATGGVISSKSIVGPDTVEFRMVTASPPEWKCKVGDAGTYRFGFSADGQRLTLTAVGDVCAVRQGVLAGDWLRTEMGELAPGRHVSGVVKPFGKAGGQVSYTVPAGWSDGWECADCLFLGSPGYVSSINLYTSVTPSGSPAHCLLGSGGAPTDIAAWLGTLPSLTVSPATTVTIGGLTGVQVDVSASAGSPTDTCPFLMDGSGNVSLEDPDLPDMLLSVPSKGASRWIFLDRGDGSSLLLDVETDDRAAWDGLLANAMSVVQTFEFGTRHAPAIAPASVDTATLESKWTSIGARPIPGTAVSRGTDIVIDRTYVTVDGLKGRVDSSWSLVGPADLALVTRTDDASLTKKHWDCQTGQQGDYRVTLSADGKTMTLTPVTDACTTRAGILAGDWARWPCPNPDSTCQPELTAGRHVTDLWPPGGTGTTVPRSVAYTVPSGWSQPVGSPMSLGRPNDPGTMAISITSDVAPHNQAAYCPDSPEPGIGHSATAMATWLAHLPGLVSTSLRPVTIGGYQGQMVDVSVSPTRSAPCDNASEARNVFTFTDPIAPPNGPDIRVVLEGDAHSRYILLDLGAGHNLLIDIGAPDKASWDEFVPAAMPIVNSLEVVR